MVAIKINKIYIDILKFIISLIDKTSPPIVTNIADKIKFLREKILKSP